MDLTPELVNMTGHEGFLPLNHLLDESDRIRIPTHLVSEIVSHISAVYSAILIGKWNRRLWIHLLVKVRLYTADIGDLFS